MKLRPAAALPRDAWAIGAVGTVAIHGALLAILVFGVSRGPTYQPLVYSVELVAAPAPTSAQRAPAAAPPAPPAAPTVAPKLTRSPKAAPIPKPKAPPKVNPKAEPVAQKPAATQPLAAGATPGVGVDADNVKVQGAPFPFPDYLRNLTNQILRRWGRPLGTAALEAEVSFTIGRDGSVTSIKMVRGSRNYSFDLGAQGAVEQAAAERAFGPLPAGWQSDILQVAFLFTPRNR